MSSKKPSPNVQQQKQKEKLDDKTLDKLYYLRSLFGALAGILSGLIPPQLGPFSVILLILFFLLSNNFMRHFILKNKADPPSTHGLGVFVLSWIVCFGFIATIVHALGIWGYNL